MATINIPQALGVTEWFAQLPTPMSFGTSIRTQTNSLDTSSTPVGDIYHIARTVIFHKYKAFTPFGELGKIPGYPAGGIFKPIQTIGDLNDNRVKKFSLDLKATISQVIDFNVALAHNLNPIVKVEELALEQIDVTALFNLVNDQPAAKGYIHNIVNAHKQLNGVDDTKKLYFIEQALRCENVKVSFTSSSNADISLVLPAAITKGLIKPEAKVKFSSSEDSLFIAKNCYLAISARPLHNYGFD